jgi:hypothetical protein
MTQITPPKAYRVDIVEYERGWGSKIDETLYFDDEQEAKDYATNYNKKHNTAPTAPDWYMAAQYSGRRT